LELAPTSSSCLTSDEDLQQYLTQKKRRLSNTKAKFELANIKQKNVDSRVSKALD